jgi:hypothetical protein
VGRKLRRCHQTWRRVEKWLCKRAALWELRPLRGKILILRIISGRLALHKPHDSRESWSSAFTTEVLDGPARLQPEKRAANIPVGGVWANAFWPGFYRRHTPRARRSRKASKRGRLISESQEVLEVVIFVLTEQEGGKLAGDLTR